MLRFIGSIDDDKNFPDRQINSVFRKWENNIYGEMIFSHKESLFFEHHCHFANENELKSSFKVFGSEKVIAKGFISYILEYVPNKIFKNEFEIYERYYNTIFEKYKLKEAIKPNSNNRNLELEFYEKYLLFEKKNIEESYLLRNYLRKEEVEAINNYSENYFKYIEQKYFQQNSRIDKLNVMNAKIILVNAIKENREQKTSLQSYFKREAKLAQRDNFVEFEDFFKGCLYSIECYKNEIIRRHNKRYNENNLPLHFYKQAIQRGEMLDGKGEPIQNHIDDILSDKQFIESRGYKNNYDYVCWLTSAGEITDDFLIHEVKLHWQDIEQIEQGILQAQKELISNKSNYNTKKELEIQYKQYSSFEEALKSCTVEDKILLHSINYYCNPCFVKPIDVFNDVLMFQAKYIDEPVYCLKYLKEKYKNNGKETFVIAHILRGILDNKSDFILMFNGYENENTIKEFEAIKNSFRKKLTVNFDLFAGVLLKDPNNPDKICTTHTITDELALHHLSINPECKNKFSVLPKNLDELLNEYKRNTSNTNKSIDKKNLNPLEPKHRVINSDKLKEYFKPEFWNTNDGYVNYFDTFISELESNRVAKEFAEIALMIYESKYMNSRKPIHFSDWYKIFCEYIDCDQKKYEPKDLRPPRKNLLSLFNYLT